MMYRTLLTGICSAALATLALAGSNQSSIAHVVEPAATTEAISLDLTVATPEDRGVIGVTLSDEGGAPGIETIFDGSPAEKAGLKPGDKIVSVNGQKIGSLDALVEVLGKRKAGDRIKVGVERDGWRKDVKVVLASPENIAEFGELEAEEHEHAAEKAEVKKKAEAQAKKAKAAARKAANAEKQKAADKKAVAKKKADAKKKAELKKKAAAEKRAARAKQKAQQKSVPAARLLPAAKSTAPAATCESAATCDSASSCSSAATCDSATSCESKVDQKVVAQLSALGYVVGTEAAPCSSGGGCSATAEAPSCASGGCSATAATPSCPSSGGCSATAEAPSCASGGCAATATAPSCPSSGGCSAATEAPTCAGAGTATTPCADGCACVQAPQAKTERIAGARSFVISDGGGAQVIDLQDIGIDIQGLEQFITTTGEGGEIQCEVHVVGVGDGGRVIDFTQGCEDEDIVISPDGHRTITRTITLGGGGDSCCDEVDVQKRVTKKVIRLGGDAGGNVQFFGGAKGCESECGVTCEVTATADCCGECGGDVECKVIEIGAKGCESECETKCETGCGSVCESDAKFDIRRNEVFHISADEFGEQGGHQVLVTEDGGRQAMFVFKAADLEGSKDLLELHNLDLEAIHGAHGLEALHGAHGLDALHGAHGEQDGTQRVALRWVQAGEGECCGECDDDDDACGGDCGDCGDGCCGECDDCGCEECEDDDEVKSDFFLGSAPKTLRIRRPADVRAGTTETPRRRVQLRTPRVEQRDVWTQRPPAARGGVDRQRAELDALRQELEALRAELRELRRVLKEAHN